jgi:hypothetical protein
MQKKYKDEAEKLKGSYLFDTPEIERVKNNQRNSSVRDTVHTYTHFYAVLSVNTVTLLLYPSSVSTLGTQSC